MADERLFVYGTLAPGRPNEHVLADVPGTWQAASVAGTLIEEGWGAALGYPAIVLGGETGGRVQGWVFSSPELAAHWARLDDFEGDGYTRALTIAVLENGVEVDAHVYVLRDAPIGDGGS